MSDLCMCDYCAPYCPCTEHERKRTERGSSIAVEAVLLAVIAVVAVASALWLGEVVTERVAVGVGQTGVEHAPSGGRYYTWSPDCDKYGSTTVEGVPYAYVVTPSGTFTCPLGVTEGDCGSGCLVQHTVTPVTGG